MMVRVVSTTLFYTGTDPHVERGCGLAHYGKSLAAHSFLKGTSLPTGEKGSRHSPSYTYISLNKHFTDWSLRELANHVVEKDIVESISHTTVFRWLGEADIKPHKWEYWLNSKDPDFY